MAVSWPPRDDAALSMISTDPARVRSGLGHGVRTSLRNNLSAYGFSVMITATFGVLSATAGSPGVGDVFSFVAGAVTGVSVIDAIATHGFKYRFRSEETDVIALAAALGYVSVGIAVGVAAGIGSILDGWIGWGIGAGAAALVYVVLSGFEMTLARIAQEDRESEEKDEPQPD
jgi:hypothetical protein